jgi:hypothetical protein
MTCETLFRTLLAQQAMRGGILPRTLYLQLDNCIRENKNTVFFSYLAWLIERGIFDNVFVSFLPVGHTHFDCDALASRLSVAMKYNNVLDIDTLVELIKQCNSPAPAVEMIDVVIDMKELFNPGGVRQFPVASSRVRWMSGCCTKVFPPVSSRFFMQMTSPLHFWIRIDLTGKVFIQSKLTCDDAQWSMQHYPWTPTAPRPDDRPFKEGYSGLRPSDLRTAPQKFLSAKRATELEKSMPAVRHRLSQLQWDEVSRTYASLQVDSFLQFKDVLNDGLFMGETDDPLEREPVQSEEEVVGMFLRPESRIFENTNRQAIDRENRKRRGRADTELIIGNLVAVTVNYEEQVPIESRNDFWVGKIVNLDHANRDLTISYYNTGTVRNVTNNRAKYRAWTGAWPRDTMSIGRVLYTFDKFTPGMQIISHTRRAIRAAMDLPDSDDEAADIHAA